MTLTLTRDEMVVDHTMSPQPGGSAPVDSLVILAEAVWLRLPLQLHVVFIENHLTHQLPTPNLAGQSDVISNPQGFEWDV